ncbi:hypothetical protein EDC04DRAFT_2605228 [Pisolithus marmoratus]|nr:hypothetical protein EDC04DRAFT_2605228 [Pisolithus marmoratus]
MLLGARRRATIQKAAANEYEPVTQVVSLMEHSEDLDPDEISRCFTGNCSAKTLHLSPKMLCRLPRKGTIIFRTRTYCVDIEELVKEGIPVAVRFGKYRYKGRKWKKEKTGKTMDHTDENKHAIAISRFVSIGVKMTRQSHVGAMRVKHGMNGSLESSSLSELPSSSKAGPVKWDRSMGQ